MSQEKKSGRGKRSSGPKLVVVFRIDIFAVILIIDEVVKNLIQLLPS